MSDPKIKLKRSSVEGKIPTPDQVPLGELALNTYDGQLYASKNVGVGTTVIAINPFKVGTGTDSYDAYFTQGNVGIGTEVPDGPAHSSNSSVLNVGVVTANYLYGDGSNLTGISGSVVSGVVTNIQAGSNVTILESPAGNFIITATASGDPSTRTVTSQTATAGQTTFSVSYTVNNIDVYLNGAKLEGSEFTATNGTSVVLATGATANDVLEFVVYKFVGVAVTITGSNGQLQYHTNGTLSGAEVYYTNGNLGIGTATPLNPVSVGNTAILSVGVVTANYFYGDGSNLTGLQAGYFEKTSAGIHTLSNIGIGTTNPTSALTVSGDADVTGVVTASSFVGNLTGNVTGDATGLSGSPSITVTDITASGNVSIAGTLTYEDVTNVDSIGLITARSGIIATGVVTATSFVKSSNSGGFLKADGTEDTSTYLTSFTETNDLSSSVTWANVPNANITESSVTQHQAALSITESQISDLQSYLTSYTETQTLNDVLGLGNTSSLGMSVGLVTTTELHVGIDTGFFTEDLVVNGDARITGILSVGTSTIILDPTVNKVQIGTGITLDANANTIEVGGTTIADGNGNATFSGVVTATSFVKSSNSGGFLKADGTEDTNTYLTSYTETQTLNDVLGLGNTSSTGLSVGVVTATSFFGDGSNLTGIQAGYWEKTDVGINTSTNIGIGTTNPTSALTVSGDANVTGVVTATTFVGNLTGNATGLSGSPSITVTDITASGNVSIAGTLTYEDVTNVDSIGLITARSGIIATGVVTATSFSGDGSNLTGLATALSEFTNDVGFVTFTNNNQLINGAGYITTSFTSTSQLTNDAGFITNVVSGVLTATSFSGDGSNLTGIQAGYWEKTDVGINTSTNIGIGTTNPTSALTVSGDANVTGVVTASSFVGSATSLTSLTGASSGTYGTTGVVPVITVDANGRITGITTTNANLSDATTRSTTRYTATSGQTTFSVNYVVGYVDVFQNGVKLDGTEFTATSGTSVVLTTGAVVDDIIEFVAYNSVGLVSSSLTTRATTSYTATAGQTTFSVDYVVGYVDVYLNGVKLVSSDFTATNGTSVVLGTGAAVNDVVEFVAYSSIGITSLAVSSDSTPQLSGNLDLNSNDIIGTGNINITGVITATSFVGDGSNLTGFQAGYFEKTSAGINTLSNIGIGTTNPTSALTVSGDANVTGVVTATSFVGNLTGSVTGDATGLSGSPSITVTDLTASGNVSIAGTLTYQDVTNIDSVGLVTARSGIHVTGGSVGIGTDNPTAALHAEGRNFSFGGPLGTVSTGNGEIHIGNYDDPLLDSYDRNIRIGSQSEIQIELYTKWTATEYSDSIIFSSPQGLGWLYSADNGNSTRSGVYPFYYNVGNAKTDDYIFWQAGDRYLWFDADTGRLGVNRGTGNGWSDTLDVNGTARVTGVAKFDSNVGIGTDNPDELLEVGNGTVVGGLKVSGQSTGITDEGITFDWASSSNAGRIFSESAGDSILQFYTTSSGTRGERLRISSGGFITQKFTSNNSTTAEGLFINNLNNGTGNNASLILSNDSGERKKAAISLIDTGSYGAGDLVFAVDGADSGELHLTNDEKVRITSNGDVGIGIDSPSCRLQVKDTATHTAYASQTPSIGDCTIAVVNNPSSEAINNHATIQFNVTGGTYNRVCSISAIAESASNRYSSLTFCTDDAGSRTEKVRITSDGRLLVGTTTTRANFFNSTNWKTQVQIENNSDQESSLSLICSHPTSNQAGLLILGATKASSIGGNGLTGSSQGLGIITFQGNDGTNMVEAARIACVAAGSPGADNMPGELRFSVNSGSGSATERLRILSSGGITFNGDTAAANALDDYEEGTWTPTLSTTWSVPAAGASPVYSGRYTKVGNKVTCYLRFNFDSPLTAYGLHDRFSFTGLPYASSSNYTELPAVGTVWVYNSMSSGNNAFGQASVNVNSSVVYIYITSIDGSVGGGNNGTAGFTYFTDS